MSDSRGPSFCATATELPSGDRTVGGRPMMMSELQTAASGLLTRTGLLAILILLLIHLTVCLHTAARMSVTNDEFWHIPVGLRSLQEWRFDHDRLNPPVARCLAALPLLVGGVDAGTTAADEDKEAIGDAFAAANREHYSHVVWLSRLVPSVLSTLTAAAIAWLAFRMSGQPAALAGTALWCFSPNAFAHGSLATTDVPAAFFGVLVVVFLHRFAERASAKRATAFGLLLGLAQAVKFTNVLLLFCAPLLFAAFRYGGQRRNDLSKKRLIVLWTGSLLIALFALNSAYLFRGTGRTMDGYAFQSQILQRVQEMFGPFGSIPIPLPADYLLGLDQQRHIMEGGHPVFLDGVWRFEGGFRDYFAKAVWYKMPHTTQLICLLGVLQIFAGGNSVQRWQRLAILLPAVLLFSIASLSSMQLGIRYLLPAFPFVFLNAALLFPKRLADLRLRHLLIVLLFCLLPLSLRHHPHHIPYFNELAGGPADGHLHLLDSNVDWGQGLLELRDYLERQDVNQPFLAYFGAVNPRDLAIRFRVPPKADLPHVLWPRIEPGLYAVSRNFAYGRPGIVRNEFGHETAVNAYEYKHLTLHETELTIGHCIEIIRVTAAAADLRPLDEPAPEER